VEVAARFENALHLGHHTVRILHVFQHGIAFDALEDPVAKGQALRVGRDIDSGNGDHVQIDVALNSAAGSTDIQIPSAEGKIHGLRWISHQRLRRREKP
jgi:hypothetical protein